MPLTLTLPDRLSNRQRRWATGAGALLGTTALLAIAIPVSVHDAAVAQDRTVDDVPAGTAVPQEDLTAFLDTKRWGRSLREIQAELADAKGVVAGGINPVLAEMGYVGLIVTEDRYAMLLTLPDGKVARHALGDLTPDGRTVSALTDNTLTLTGSDDTEQVLELFPRQALEADG